MHYKVLGKSDLKVSTTSFGCKSLPATNPEESIQLLQQAFTNGINYFDTADLYDKGENEKLVGQAFRENRHQVIIATKVGNQWRTDGSGWDWNPRKEYILKAVEGSLQRLQTDYLDLYQLHGGTLDDPIDETIETFELLKQQGKIRNYGISSIRPNVIREYIKRSNIVSVMMQYSLLDRRPEETVLDLLQENQIGVVTRGSLAQGLLAGKPPKTYLGYSEQEVKKVIEAIQNLVTDNLSMADVAVQYVLHHPAVASTVLGIRTQTQLQEALYIPNAEALSNNNLNFLQQSLHPLLYEQHR
ncbi:aldo/keto reductase [Adhaeribacter radiodurans]|uniref:Aldo/keto reductase n=1 Tax=Adhaeribacter radiodurans TaxID=2745197 RepID=A0A7L7LA25_9BACT|nr:aldo/keto reductase [Adhaeribacter radiodurans]QMU29587.1 aldo/keto reductase [Adhaeribacter radiodurans]